jgi:hypothetical protein
MHRPNSFNTIRSKVFLRIQMNDFLTVYFIKIGDIIIIEMYRHQSVGKLSSRSLSKIKTKVEMAFGKPINN